MHALCNMLLQIHPIFMLSIADFMLAVLWGVGGIMWLVEMSTHFDRDGCFAVLLATVVSDLRGGKGRVEEDASMRVSCMSADIGMRDSEPDVCVCLAGLLQHSAKRFLQCLCEWWTFLLYSSIAILSPCGGYQYQGLLVLFDSPLVCYQISSFSFQSLFEKNLNKHVWQPWKTVLVYLISW